MFKDLKAFEEALTRLQLGLGEKCVRQQFSDAPF